MKKELYFWICSVCGNNNDGGEKECQYGNSEYTTQDMFPIIKPVLVKDVLSLKSALNTLYGDPDVLKYCENDAKVTLEVYKKYKAMCKETFNPRLFKNSIAIIRTKKGNVVGCHMFSTYNYIKLKPKQFDYKGYCGQSFEITESVGGTIVVLVKDKLQHSNIEFTNTVRIDNVTAIEIISEHDQ